MSERIDVMQIRNTLEIVRKIIPYLNQEELKQLMIFFNGVLERLEKEATE